MPMPSASEWSSVSNAMLGYRAETAAATSSFLALPLPQASLFHSPTARPTQSMPAARHSASRLYL